MTEPKAWARLRRLWRGWIRRKGGPLRPGGGFLSEIPSRPHTSSLPLELQKINAIENEIERGLSAAGVERLLRPFFEEQDPWVHACAAKALHRVQPQEALSRLRHLVRGDGRDERLAGVWALGELFSLEALETLAQTAWDDDRDVQQAAIRCLLQTDGRADLPPDVRARVRSLLGEIRAKTEWVI